MRVSMRRQFACDKSDINKSKLVSTTIWVISIHTDNIIQCCRSLSFYILLLPTLRLKHVENKCDWRAYSVYLHATIPNIMSYKQQHFNSSQSSSSSLSSYPFWMLAINPPIMTLLIAARKRPVVVIANHDHKFFRHKILLRPGPRCPRIFHCYIW